MGALPRPRLSTAATIVSDLDDGRASEPRVTRGRRFGGARGAAQRRAGAPGARERAAPCPFITELTSDTVLVPGVLLVGSFLVPVCSVLFVLSRRSRPTCPSGARAVVSGWRDRRRGAERGLRVYLLPVLVATIAVIALFEGRLDPHPARGRAVRPSGPACRLGAGRYRQRRVRRVEPPAPWCGCSSNTATTSRSSTSWRPRPSAISFTVLSLHLYLSPFLFIPPSHRLRGRERPPSPGYQSASCATRRAPSSTGSGKLRRRPSAYDATYVALAELLGCSLTADMARSSGLNAGTVGLSGPPRRAPGASRAGAAGAPGPARASGRSSRSAYRARPRSPRSSAPARRSAGGAAPGRATAGA